MAHDNRLRWGLLRWGFAPVRHHGSTWPLDVYRCRLPTSLSWAGRPGRLEIPLSAATTSTGFSYGQDGWHPHAETLRWREATRGADPMDSPLGRLYSVFQPWTVREAIFDDLEDPIPGLSDAPLVRGQLRELWNPYGGRSLDTSGELDRPGLYWGPADREYVAGEIERTWRVYKGLAASGLRDDGPGKDAISGYLLVRGDDYRFVVHQGHHRLACLAVLGHTSVPAYLAYKVPPIIREDGLARWSEGRRPRYTPLTVRLLFSRLFDSTGLEKAARLGLAGGASKRLAADA
jgi:hypothetical protein